LPKWKAETRDMDLAQQQQQQQPPLLSQTPRQGLTSSTKNSVPELRRPVSMRLRSETRSSATTVHDLRIHTVSRSSNSGSIPLTNPTAIGAVATRRHILGALSAHKSMPHLSLGPPPAPPPDCPLPEVPIAISSFQPAWLERPPSRASGSGRPSSRPGLRELRQRQPRSQAELRHAASAHVLNGVSRREAGVVNAL
jgi:hypothetical protein